MIDLLETIVKNSINCSLNKEKINYASHEHFSSHVGQNTISK